jgi:Protein kinase domain
MDPLKTPSFPVFSGQSPLTPPQSPVQRHGHSFSLDNTQSEILRSKQPLTVNKKVGTTPLPSPPNEFRKPDSKAFEARRVLTRSTNQRRSTVSAVQTLKTLRRPSIEHRNTDSTGRMASSRREGPNELPFKAKGVDASPTYNFPTPPSAAPLLTVPTVPTVFGEVETIDDEVYGSGAVSVVRPCVRISRRTIPSSANATPPYSNETVLAVKAAFSPSDRKILKVEALILTHLMRFAGKEHVVTFHGVTDVESYSLVLDAIPTTLDSLIYSSHQENISPRKAPEPIIGTKPFVTLARELIAGLEFMHRNGVVHGDIKPLNILLKAPKYEGGVPTPVYCDFSSSHMSKELTGEDPADIHATTPYYTSKYLMNRFLRGPRGSAVATTHDDVYSLGMTLLVLALGRNPYDPPGYTSMQKNMWKNEYGPKNIIQMVGDIDMQARMKKGSLVETIVGDSVSWIEEKQGNWTLERWTNVIEEAGKASDAS